RSVGKAKRLREVLYEALENDINSGERLVFKITSNVRSVGGFRQDSKNYVGRDAIENFREALKAEGYILTSIGEIQPVTLENLSNRDTRNALKSYIRRAQRGIEDAALVVGELEKILWRL